MFQILDLRTLVFAHGLLLLSASIGCVIAARYLQRFAALPYWGLASMLMGLGYLLLSGRGLIAVELSVLLANAFICAAVSLVVLAVARDLEMPVSLTALGACFCTSMLGMFLAFYLVPSTDLRFVFISGICGGLAWYAAWMVWRYLRRPDCIGIVVGILVPLLVNGGSGLFMAALSLWRVLCGHPTVETYPGSSVFGFSYPRLASSLLAVLSSLGLFYSMILFMAMRLNVELQRQAHHDELTGLYNRRIFYELVEHELAQDLRRGVTSSLLFIDIDHFKQINDRFGHAAGDFVLQRFADFLRQQCRQGDVIARFGGEEFCVLMPTVDAKGAQQAAERLCQGVRELSLMWEGLRLPITLSVGVTERLNFSESIDPLIRRADHAMYQAKHGGRNQVVLASG